VIVFDVALIVPLLTVNASDTVKITLGVISSSWIQWWHCRRCSAPVEVNGKELRTSYPSNK